MSPVALVLLGVAAVAVILALIIKVKAHPFIALLLVSVGLALASGIPLNELVPLLEDGMGTTLGSVALIVTLGAMLGKIIEVSGGADVLAKMMLRRFGPDKAPWALGTAAFIFGIPVFVDVALIVLMPIILSVGRRLQGNMLNYALPTVMGLLTVHVVLPPHPGIVGGAQVLGANIGMVLLLGFIPAIIMWICAQLVIPFITRRAFSPVPAIPATDLAESGEEFDEDVTQSFPHVENPPSPGLVISMILIPLVLIMTQTLTSMLLPEENPAVAFFSFVGASPMALLIGVITAAIVLGYRRGWGLSRAEDVINSALPPVAAVILITGAGGTFGHVLKETGVADAVAQALAGTGLHVLVLSWLMAALIRAAQGSATVATLTTAPLIAPLISSMHLAPLQVALVAVTIGIGSMALSHVNDSLFWVWSRYNKVTTATALKSYTVLTTVTSIAGFCVALIMWPIISAIA
ncbi:GntP family permease [Kocuria massiliensis]|uniref:GntP family permease n=1 Tax=Kocuria massiliensis TaxID=1926282 RepID=UPI000A1C9682|nr:gluconate:H+ symporter [Kocuria massiliensis]